MRATKFQVHDALILLGAALVIAGIASYSWRAAVITAGAALLGAGVKAANRTGS